MSESSKVIHEDAVEWTEAAQGKFGYRRKSFTRVLGAKMIGFSLYEVAPGKSAFPSHFHCANEEAIYVLEGAGTLRLGEQEIPLRKGHFVTLPPGAGNAHRLVNSTGQTLRYICVSTAVEPDAMVYPDSDKIGVMASASGGPNRRPTFMFKRGTDVGYYEGEPDA